MTYSIIQKSQLEGGLRLDSEFYHPEKLEAMEKLLKFGVSAIAENFRNVKKAFNPLRHQLATTSARVFDLSDVSSFLLEEGKKVAGPDEVGSTKKIFRQNDVLISRLRPYLKEVSFVGFNDVQKLASTEFIVLRKKKDSKFPPQALFAFLITDEVQKILFWSQGGTEHPRFSENLLMDLKLPKLSEKTTESISDDVNSAYENYLTSRNLYSQAENLLLEELGMKDFKIEDDLFNIVNLSDTQKVNRLDAEYYQKKYEKIIDRIKKYKGGFDELENLSSLVDHPINPPYERRDAKNKTFIITQKHLANYFPVDEFWEDEEALYTTDNFIQKNKKFILQKNDIILYSVGAYIGEANIYNAHTKATIGSFLTLIRPKHEIINPFYLLVYLNSSIGKTLTRRNQRGLAQQYIYPYDTKKILIPKLGRNAQKEIEKLILKGQQCHNASKRLLDEAKRKVEEMIEKR